MYRYEVIPHTADFGIEVEAGSLEELFCGCAEGMFYVMLNLEDISLEKERMVSVKAESIEDLLIEWLSEWLFLFEVENLVFRKFKIKRLFERENIWVAEGVGCGEYINKEKHRFKAGVKAVTYHNLKILKEDNLYKVSLIFDV